MGKSIASFCCGTAGVELALIPYGGHTTAYPASGRNLRWRRVVFVGAGPLASLLLSLAAWLVLKNSADAFGQGNLVYVGFSSILPISGAIAFASIFGLEGYAADGHCLVSLLSNEPVSVSEHLNAFRYSEGLHQFERRKMVGATRWLRRFMRTADSPLGSDWKIFLAQVFATADRYEIDTMRLLRETSVDISSKCHEEWAEVADAFACNALYAHRPTQYPAMKELLEIAVQRAPASITLKGTLGSLCFETGEMDKAELLLREVHETSPDPFDRGITAAYLAVLASSRNEPAEAARLIGLATELTGAHPLVRRVLKDPAVSLQ